MNLDELVLIAQSSKRLLEGNFSISNAVFSVLVDQFTKGECSPFVNYQAMVGGTDKSQAWFAVVGFETESGLSLGFPLPKVEKSTLGIILINANHHEWWLDDCEEDCDGELDITEDPVGDFIDKNCLREVSDPEQVLWKLLFEEVPAHEISRFQAEYLDL